jgi:hypothetical protein
LTAAGVTPRRLTISLSESWPFTTFRKRIYHIFEQVDVEYRVVSKELHPST